jgi:hypothetical protein
MSRTLVIKQILPLLLASTLASLVQAKDINIGWSGPGTWTTLPFIVAGERGFFQKENLAVRMITFRGINVLMAALISGELDYATILPNLAVSAARGIPVKILSSVTKGSTFANRKGLEFRRKSAALKSFCACCGCWDLSRLFSPLRLFHMAALSCTVPITVVSCDDLSNRQFNSVHRLLFPALSVKLFADSRCLNLDFRWRFLFDR